MKIAIAVVCALAQGSALGRVSDEDSPKRIHDRSIELHRRARDLPDVSLSDVDVAVDAALLVETRQVPAELLVAIAWGESRFQASTVTYRACGLLQVLARDRKTCLALQVPIVGMLVGRRELEDWLVLARGDLKLALLGNACGMSAFNGTCTKTAWPAWVLRRAQWLGMRVSS